MPSPPLPDVPCVRVKLDYRNNGPGTDGGSRFYLSYSGSAPTGANCTTLAGDIASAWSSYLAQLINNSWSLVEVDVLDIATNSGLSGQWGGTDNGVISGTNLASQIACNVEFGIGRRYRGGKPRMYLPPPTTAQELDSSHFNSTHVSNCNTAVANFFANLEGLSIGSMGTLQHVNLSYYKGFTNHTDPSGRQRAIPTYRGTAVHDNVTGYFTKALMGSQRRRRIATTY